MATTKLTPMYRLQNGALYAPPSGITFIYSSMPLDLIYDTRNMDVSGIAGTIASISIDSPGAYNLYISYGFVKIVNGKYIQEYSGGSDRSFHERAGNTISGTGRTLSDLSFQLIGYKEGSDDTFLRLRIDLGSTGFIVEGPEITVTYENHSADQTPTLKASPSSPSGGGVSFSTNTTFSWSISSVPDGVKYVGTQLQMTKATDTTGSEIFYDTTIAGLTTQHIYTGNLAPNMSYIWRTRAIVAEDNTTNTSSNPSDEYEELIIEEDILEEGDGSSQSAPVKVLTPWSDWKAFTTKDYEYVSVRIQTSSPEGDASFVEGNQIQFRWSISGGSGIVIESSTLMVDGVAFATIQGTGTSYTYQGSSGRLSQGAHVWYVTASTTAENNGILITGTPESDRSTFYITPPTAKASPSSPAGSTSVYGNAPVTFTWSISKDGDGSYTGSQLEYRYSNESSWRFLGKTDKGITSFTFQNGFTPNTVVQWHVRTGLDNVYASDGGWSEPVSFTVGDVEIYKATPSLIAPKGTVKGDQPIQFAWTVKSDGVVESCELEYSADGGITWKLLTRINQTLQTYTYTSTQLFPAGSIEYRVRAKANGPDYGDWVQSSFTVSYDAYGSIEVDSSSLRQAALRDQQLEIKANLRVVGQTTESISFKKATFCWKMASGTEYRDENMAISGTSASIYLPARKFPVGALCWYLKAEDSKDNDSETAVNVTYMLSSGIDTFPIGPQSIIHEAEDSLTFSWGFIDQNEKVSKSTEFRFSKDGATFDPEIWVPASTARQSRTITDPDNVQLEDLYTGTGFYTFPGEYFAAGRVYWQVRSIAQNGIIGAWSDTSLFIVRGIPRIQSFTCDEKPFTTFKWSVNEQSSYSITIDNSLYYGPFHGDETSFQLPEPLSDGSHTAALQIQNYMGAISNEMQLSFQVRNIASAAASLKLFISAKIDAVLSWHPINVSDDNEFLVYRDDNLIARLESSATTYRDRSALGEHTYKVIQRLGNNYYDVYIHEPVSMHSNVTRIGLLNGLSWFDLVLTKDPYPTNDYSHKRLVEKTRVMGTKYPVMEVSEFEERNGSYSVCWPFENYAQADIFNSLLGMAIVVKSRADMVLCGVLESYDISANSQYIECTFSLDQMSIDQDLSIAMKPEESYNFMTDLDKIYFGQMSDTKLSTTTTNPGYTNPQYYEEIAKAINERIRSNPFRKKSQS